MNAETPIRPGPPGATDPGPTGPRAPHPPRARPAWSVRGPMTLGLVTAIVLVAGFGGWSVTATLASAIVAPARVEVERHGQAIQHPEGGVVAEILVAEGDRVAAGAVLLRLDPAAIATDLTVTRGQLDEIRARRARLEAERDDRDSVLLPADLQARRGTDATLADLLRGQDNLFAARRDTLAGEIRQLRQRRGQIDAQIDALDAQEGAIRDQLALVEDALARRQGALDRGLARAEPVLRLRRDAAQLQGQLGEIAARRAEAAERRAETEIVILQRRDARREAAIAELREIRVAERELRERVADLERRQAALDLRAPVAGTIHGLRAFGPRSVLRPADPVAHVVPAGRPLVVIARVPALHIDEVVVGQPVDLRFPAFDQRRMLPLSGRVTRVSADAFVDEATGVSYYRTEVAVDAGQADLLAGRDLVPGMPAEAYIRTGDRRPLDYLIEPFAAYFSRALRES